MVGLCAGGKSSQRSSDFRSGSGLLAEPTVRTVLFVCVRQLSYVSGLANCAGWRIHRRGFMSGVLLQFINHKAYAVNTSLFTSFAFYPDNFAVETGLKLLIMNMIWLPLHLLWLFAGVELHALNLSARSQRRINLVMAACLLAVVVLSVWSVLALTDGGPS